MTFLALPEGRSVPVTDIDPSSDDKRACEGVASLSESVGRAIDPCAGCFNIVKKKYSLGLCVDGEVTIAGWLIEAEATGAASQQGPDWDGQRKLI